MGLDETSSGCIRNELTLADGASAGDLVASARAGEREGEHMVFVNDATLRRMREMYPAGTRVELLQMDDPQAPPIGTIGTVIGVDDAGSILVNWDTGSRLNVAYGQTGCGN